MRLLSWNAAEAAARVWVCHEPLGDFGSCGALKWTSFDANVIGSAYEKAVAALLWADRLGGSVRLSRRSPLREIRLLVERGAVSPEGSTMETCV